MAQSQDAGDFQVAETGGERFTGLDVYGSRPEPVTSQFVSDTNNFVNSFRDRPGSANSILRESGREFDQGIKALDQRFATT